MSETVEKTVVKEVDMDLSEILGLPGMENMMNQTTKPNIFTKEPHLDIPFEEDEPGIEAGKEKEKEIKDPELVIPEIEQPGDQPKEKKTFTSKKDLVDFTKNLIEKKVLIPFDDDKPLEEYTTEDFQELFDTNFQEKERKVREEVPAQFFQSLPEELQYAAKYHADGGKDLKGLFQALAQAQEVAEIDITTTHGQESTVRQYLLATNYGTPDEIEEEIDGLKDRGELKTKANKFKPKLDNMQQQIIASKLEREEVLRKKREAQAAVYTDSVYKVLESGNLNGLKLDRKTQNTLFAGLVQPNQPSVTGKQVNLLGHLLEKYQFVEPNHALLAEALWLLADPDTYRQKVKESGKKEAVAQTVRQLKSEQASRNGSSTQEEDEVKGNKLARPSRNFFART